MKTATRSELLENEWFHVRYSGETPEIALHSSLYHLTEDKEGPGMQLNKQDQEYLLEAARQRYCDIIFRDMLPENRDLTIYRGVFRSICNWRRFKMFCQRHDMEWRHLKGEVAEKFISFLQVDITDVEDGLRSSSINCSFEELLSFSIELGVVLEDIHENVGKFCLDQ